MSDRGLGSWVARRSAKSGEAVAVVHEGVGVTYAELGSRVRSLAGALHARGVGSGDRVAYLGDNHPSFLETFFASATLGAVFVPLNTRWAAPEIEFALEDSGSSVLVYAEPLARLVAGVGESRLPVRLIRVGEESGEVRPATSGGGAPPATSRGERYDDVVAAGTDADGPPEVDVTLEHPAIILYTSGTTGRPKGAVLSHGNLTWNAFNVIVDYDLTSADRALMISPLFHVASLGMGALPCLLKGATVFLESRFDPGGALRMIEQNRITWLSGVPTTFQLMREHPLWESTDLSSLAQLTCGGSPIPLSVLEAYESRGLSFTGGYGMTEASPGVSSLQPAMSRTKAGSAGLPHFFTEVRIVGDDGAELPAGAVGEIEICGPNVMERYWNREAETARAFDGAGWFRSGDLGRFDAGGYLFIVDRLKDMIISGGENVYPAEIEQLILERADVEEVAVIGVPDERWGEVPVAIVRAAPGTQPGALELREHLSGRVAKYKIPVRVVLVDALPRTASGKVKKNDLRELHGHAVTRAGA